jgi:hypothetical protein
VGVPDHGHQLRGCPRPRSSVIRVTPVRGDLPGASTDGLWPQHEAIEQREDDLGTKEHTSWRWEHRPLDSRRVGGLGGVRLTLWLTSQEGRRCIKREPNTRSQAQPPPPRD